MREVLEPVARDLRWAIESPVLCASLPRSFVDWSISGEQVPVDSELARHRRSPIGRYFERLIIHWLESQEGVVHLQANIPLRRGGSTIGELDLLFEHGGVAHHWELALKFYLGTGDRLHTSQWFGPLGRDRLDLKLDKLATQLELLETPEGKALLAERGHEGAETHALVKGYLFHPYEAWRQESLAIPAQANLGHGRGWWIHRSDAERVFQHRQRWVPLEKASWLAPAAADKSMNAPSLMTWLDSYFDADSRPPMLAAVNEEGREVERGFVVPDDWEPQPRSESAG